MPRTSKVRDRNDFGLSFMRREIQVSVCVGWLLIHMITAKPFLLKTKVSVKSILGSVAFRVQCTLKGRDSILLDNCKAVINISFPEPWWNWRDTDSEFFNHFHEEIEACAIDKGNYYMYVWKTQQSWHTPKMVGVDVDNNSKSLPWQFSIIFQLDVIYIFASELFSHFFCILVFYSLTFAPLFVYISICTLTFSFTKGYRLIAESLCYNLNHWRERFLLLFEYVLSCSATLSIQLNLVY